MSYAATSQALHKLSLSSDQTEQFVRQGYLVCENLVTNEEITELNQDMVDLARGKYPCKSLQPMDTALSDQQILERLLCFHQPHHVSPVIQRFISHPKVVDALSNITAAHLPKEWWDGGVKCMQSMMFVKPPGLPGQAWHQDENYIPTRDRSLVGAWIALDDATVENGCLWVLPGSHRAGYLYPMREHGRPDEFDWAPEAYGFDESAAIPVEVPRGSLVFFNGYLLHRSLRNRSGTYRRALVNHYMSLNSLLPWASAAEEIKQGLIEVARADYRGAIPVSGTVPPTAPPYEAPTGDTWLRPYDRDAIARTATQ